MINFFKKLSPLNILGLAVVLLVLRAGYLFNLPAKIDAAYSAPFERLLLSTNLHYSLAPPLNVFIAGVLVFIQALLLNRLVNHFNLLGKPTFLPALMYITVSGLYTPFLVLSPPLICNFFVIWMLYKLINFYKAKDSRSTTFDLGMIVALGSLIYLPFIFFFLTIWVALIIFKPFNWREWMACIIGYTTIFFFLAVYYYLGDTLPRFGHIWQPLETKFPARVVISYYNYFLLAPVALILILCFISLRQNYYKSYIQVRKTFQLLLLMFTVAALTFYVKAAFQLSHFLLCAVPAAIFFAYYFLHARRGWFYETLYVLMAAAIVYLQFNTF
ncbi:MAG TPA: DUF6427 family protein [Mucilaginibacter sp.]|jgi:hypothetical protein|nr:DUF6427 family protein [Mucilaginibacter sp.]